MSANQPGEDDAVSALTATGVRYAVTRHGPVDSLAAAAEARGVEPAAIIKTLVVRRGEDDFLLVLVPGDRGISWPKLRSLLGVSRLSMPDAETARAATGYERGTITPFGAINAWPIIIDAQVAVMPAVSIGGGAPGVALALSGPDLVVALESMPGPSLLADVTDPL